MKESHAGAFDHPISSRRLKCNGTNIISSFNGTQSELNCERGLRYMFLFCGKFFSWGLGNREDTLPEFFSLYKPNEASCRDLVKTLLKDEKTWTEIESYWATEFRVKNILSKVSINDKDCCNKNKFLVRKTSV